MTEIVFVRLKVKEEGQIRAGNNGVTIVDNKGEPINDEGDPDASCQTTIIITCKILFVNGASNSPSEAIKQPTPR